MKHHTLLLFALLVASLLSALPAVAEAGDATLILTGARVWTGDSEHPSAQAVAVRDDKILAVGDDAAVLAHRGDGTRVIDLKGRFVAPGFIDNHTHFDDAGALILGVNLLAVSDREGLVTAVEEARDRMPPGAWIVGGDWGAYEQWQSGSAGSAEVGGNGEAFLPHRSMIEAATPNNPVLLSKWDRSVYLANANALAAAGLSCGQPGVDCMDGKASGRLTPEPPSACRR